MNTQRTMNYLPYHCSSSCIIYHSPSHHVLFISIHHLYWIYIGIRHKIIFNRTNMMLKLELDLRSQFFFISYLACVRSSIYPRLGGDLTEIPSVRGIQKTREGGNKKERKMREKKRGKRTTQMTSEEILKLCESKEETKPFSVPLSFYLGAYQYVVADKKKLTLSKKRQLQ